MEAPDISRVPTLLGIPIEVRIKIYALVIRADCNLEHHGEYGHCQKAHRCPKSFLGCTKILSVCRQVYDEAVELLHNLKEAPVLKMDGKHKKALRHPLDFGKPGYFQIAKRSCQCYLPKVFDELQLIRMRSFTLDLAFPDDSYLPNDRAFARIVENIKEVAIALGKSKTMKVLCIKIHRLGIDPYGNDSHEPAPLEDHHSMQLALRPIIQSAARSGYRLLIEDGRRPHPKLVTEPLVGWFVDLAANAGLDVEKVETPYIEPAISKWSLEDLWTDDSIGFASVVEPEDNYHASPSRSHQPEMLAEDIPNPIAPAAPYALVPQCRNKHCNALFRNKSELMAHLRQYPRHKQPFMRKTFNTIHHGAVNRCEERRCWTCAKAFEGLARLESHLDKTGHRRYGIIPKYRDDNAWWDRKWKKNKERHGWL